MVSYIKDSSVCVICAKERNSHIPFSVGISEIAGLWSSELVGSQVNITSGPKPVQYPPVPAISGLFAIFSNAPKICVGPYLEVSMVNIGEVEEEASEPRT